MPRVTPSTELERHLLASGPLVAVDEVGRGALAGPVVVGAVLVDDGEPPVGIADSKALSAARRDALVEPIHAWARGVALGTASAREIDEWGLRMALALAIDRAVVALGVVPAHVLLDGNLNLLEVPSTLYVGPPPPPRRFADLRVTTMVSGDAHCAGIAAASVVAKVARDATMRALGLVHPIYCWDRNKGYGTRAHLDALRDVGPCEEHRRSWALPPRSESGCRPVGQ